MSGARHDLLPLSLIRLTRSAPVPHVPDNRDRIRARQMVKPVELGNGLKWKWEVKRCDPTRSQT